MADQGSEGLLSPFLRRTRFRAAKKYLKGAVLDVGCGTAGLSRYVEPGKYYGVEVDKTSLEIAKNLHPESKFSSVLEEVVEKFDTVVSLAVIEHVAAPSDFLFQLSTMLKDEDGLIVITTPHPSVDWVHTLGASIGIFSKHASEEHEDLLDKRALQIAGDKVGLHMIIYERFLMNANQIAVYKKK
ncbi:MAG: hypothetical protein A2Z90_18240 [Burkholderiales bacterium GWA2_64_37]|nr:MAG: hypothetical protein A2Z90_18240 [Burkholderiales bacterium GWA2_64_37]HCE91164.1 methyltransferase type 11 [Acidovorax sp.]